MQVPPSLLLLSRTLYLPENLDPSAQLAATISALPESAASRTTAEIGIKEGKIRNVVRLEVIKEEQRKIEEEEKEELLKELKEKAVKKIKATPEAAPTSETVVAAAAAVAGGVVGERLGQEALAAAAVTATRTEAPPTSEATILGAMKARKPKPADQQGAAAVPIEKRQLSAADFAELKAAIEKLGKVRSELDTIDDLKQELEDYKEDVEDLARVKEIVQRSGLRQSMGANLLFSRVNKMLQKADEAIVKLELKKEAVGGGGGGNIGKDRPQPDEEAAAAAAAKCVEAASLDNLQVGGDDPSEETEEAATAPHLVTINELISAIQQSHHHPEKVDQIAGVRKSG